MTTRLTGGIAALLVALVCAAPAAAAPSISDVSPPGANDFSCHPSAAHPNPVVLVHGLGANMVFNWSYLSPLLAQHGYCVFALTYGRSPNAPPPFDQAGGTMPMEQSSHELAAFVDRVLAATGAAKVDLVGHSEGTVMPRYYLKFLGGAARVDRFVALTPLWRGTNLLEFATLLALGKPSGLSQQIAAAFSRDGCGSCTEFLTGSDYLNSVNAGGEAAPGVTYTSIMSRYDELVSPYTSGVLNAPMATNIVVQDQCPIDLAEHAGLAFDPITAQDVLNALDPAHARAPRCTLVLPVVGAPWIKPG